MEKKRDCTLDFDGELQQVLERHVEGLRRIITPEFNQLVRLIYQDKYKIVEHMKNEEIRVDADSMGFFREKPDRVNYTVHKFIDDGELRDFNTHSKLSRIELEYELARNPSYFRKQTVENYLKDIDSLKNEIFKDRENLETVLKTHKDYASANNLPRLNPTIKIPIEDSAQRHCGLTATKVEEDEKEYENRGAFHLNYSARFKVSVTKIFGISFDWKGTNIYEMELERTEQEIEKRIYMGTLKFCPPDRKRANELLLSLLK